MTMHFPPLSMFKRAAAIETKLRLALARPASHPWRLIIRDRHDMNACRITDFDREPDARAIARERTNASFAWFCRAQEIEHEILAPVA